MFYSLSVCYPQGELTEAFPSRGRGTAAGFPETSLSSFGGSRIAVDEV